jgi:parallel beta-helix repeat protein
MKKRIVAILVCILLLVSYLVIVSPIKALKVSGNTFYVGGSGPGNYTTIQNAIDSASSGDTVFVYNGTYYENITVDKSIDLIGEDRNITIINGNYNVVTVLIFSSRTHISNFCIKKSERSGFAQGVFIGDLNKNIWFENITVSNCIITQNGKGIYAQYISNLTIKNCDIYDNLAASIYINLGAKNINIFNCTIRTNGIETSGPDNIKSGGIFLDMSENVTISYSSIYDNIGTGVDLRGGHSYDVYNNTIYNNSWSAIHLSSTENFYIHQNNLTKNNNQGINANFVKYGIISDNFIHGNGINYDWLESFFVGGIYLGYHSKDVLIKNNNISLNSCYGIMILSSSFCNITQNHFINNNLSEIDLRGCEYIEVKDNILNENRFGIRLILNGDNKTYYCKILNNYFLSLDYYTGPYISFFGSTIYLSESDYNIIGDNTIIQTQIIDNDKAGISCEKSNENTFYKNIIKDGRYGFKALKSMNNDIKQNSFIHNLENGIYLFKSSDNLIQSNNFINNTNQAFFENGYNRWKANYWNDWTKTYPRPIRGDWVVPINIGFIEFYVSFRYWQFDWHPAKEPYDITIPDVP